MRPILEYAKFDVVIIGSGIAGALVGVTNWPSPAIKSPDP